MQAPPPLRIVLHKVARELELVYADGQHYRLPAEYLRVHSPSAEVQGHGEGKKIVTGKENVAITAIDPVGHYAVRLTFDDQHKTGLYTWVYLRELWQKTQKA